MLTSEQFLRCLRDALNHLYDPDRLRRNPLITLFGVTERFDAPSALQRILIEGIESLRPKPDDLPRSHSRMVYDLLLYRYVQQFSQQEVANQLGMSVRHLRREQHAALESLAYHLWEQFDLGARLHETVETPYGKTVAQTTAAGAVAYPGIPEELAWLKDAPPETSADLEQTLPAALRLIQPLAVQHDVRLETTLADGLPRLAVHPMALRQIILNLLGVAIHRAPGGQVHIATRPLCWEVETRVQSTKPAAAPRLALNDEEASLDIARHLASLSGGRLTFTAAGNTCDAALLLPALERLPILVVDDNADALQLLQRYTVGTRYRFIGTRDPEQTLSIAEEFSPQAIILDVMMPQIDGWEVLGRLRQHPLIGHIPIVVHSILAQEELALTLGASAFVRKPVTRQAFLAVLDQQIARTAPGSH